MNTARDSAAATGQEGHGMAKRAKKEDGNGHSARRSNGFDPEQVKTFASRVELLEAEKQILKDACKVECEPINGDINVIVEEAETAGIPKKAFRKVLAHRAAERKIEAQRRALDMMDQADYDNLRLALGDLGAAAARRAGFADTQVSHAHA